MGYLENVSVRCSFRKGFLVMQITLRRKTARLMGLAEAALEATLDFLYPPHCLLCRAPLAAGPAGFCTECWSELGVIRGPVCRRCGCPGGGLPCANCANKAFTFSRMRALMPFHAPAQRLVHMLKYRGRAPVARGLGEGLGRLLEAEYSGCEPALLLPVPLHASRRRERGYNQSALIARAAGRAMGLPVREGALVRVRPTETQTALDLAGRRANVAGAFRVRRPGVVRGLPVLLVDDVVTTGATANACAEALLEAGATEVFVAALACPYFEGNGKRAGGPDAT